MSLHCRIDGHRVAVDIERFPGRQPLYRGQLTAAVNGAVVQSVIRGRRNVNGLTAVLTSLADAAVELRPLPATKPRRGGRKVRV